MKHRIFDASICGILASIALNVLMGAACANFVPDSTKERFAIAPEYHFSEYMLEYFNYLHKDYLQRYFLENKTSLEAAFFSVGEHFYCFGEVAVNVGLGRKNGPIVLNPRDFDEAFGPELEYRTAAYTLQCGLDHHCFHQIDRDPWNTLYWNKPFVSIGSAHLRDEQFKEYLSKSPSLTWKERLTWQAEYGYFVHKFFNVFDTAALSWGNPYVHEISTCGRLAPFVGKGYAGILSWNNSVRIDRSGRWLWTEDLKAEAEVLHGAYGLSVFYDWRFIDQSIVRENRDRLMDAGLRIFM